MASALLLLALPAVFLLFFSVYRKYFCHNYFKKLGIPGPEPHWFYGNLDELWATDDRHVLLDSWSKRFGKIYGYYEGCNPVLVVGTPDAIEQVFVKQFHSVGARRGLRFLPSIIRFPDTPFCNIATVWGDRWKRLRAICNPGFSIAKLKAYTPLILKSQHEFEELLAELASSGKSFDIYEHFRCLALDVISEVAFGIELNSLKNRGTNNPVLPKFGPLLETLSTEASILKISLLFPELVPLLQSIMVYQMKYHLGILAPLKGLSDISEKVLNDRRSNPSLRRVDILQILIDASEHSVESPDGTALEPLSKTEVHSQVIQFFAAGTVTTSSCLSGLFYFLATNQNIQDKLYQEITEHFPDETTKRDYESVSKTTYTEWAILETLRLFPIGFPLVKRWAPDESTEVCGIPVEKDYVTVQANVYSVQQDPDFWGPVDPVIFYPERFSLDYPTTSSRPNSAFLGFGLGPRSCIGMRLAFYEMKLTLITTLRRFRILPPEEGYPNGLSVRVAALMIPKNGVRIRLEERDKK